MYLLTFEILTALDLLHVTNFIFLWLTKNKHKSFMIQLLARMLTLAKVILVIINIIYSKVTYRKMSPLRLKYKKRPHP